MGASDTRSGKVRTLVASAPQPTGVPSLAAAAGDPSILAGLPLDSLLELKRQHGHLGAELDAAILQRVVGTGSGRAEPVVVLDVAAAAERLGTSRDSLYRKHERLRLGYMDPLDGRLKFTEEEINSYIRRQHGG